jgi:hypothetical protein
MPYPVFDNWRRSVGSTSNYYSLVVDRVRRFGLELLEDLCEDLHSPINILLSRDIQRQESQYEVARSVDQDCRRWKQLLLNSARFLKHPRDLLTLPNVASVLFAKQSIDEVWKSSGNHSRQGSVAKLISCVDSRSRGQ